MWLFWWIKKEAVVTSKGFFNCPACARRQPCVQIQQTARGGTNASESYQCLVCHRTCTNDGSYGFDFGPHLDLPAWRCFKCDKEVPYEEFKCPHCGYRLNVNGW